MKKNIFIFLPMFLLLFAFSSEAKTIMSTDPETGRLVIKEENDGVSSKSDLPFLSEQQPTTPPPPPELNLMPQISFAETIGKVRGRPLGVTCSAGPELRGHLRFDNDVDEKIPEFRICFNGKETISDPEGFYSIPLDDEVPQEISFVFCRNFIQQFDKANTIKHVSFIPDKDCKMYTLKKNSYGSASWSYHEKKVDRKQAVIPHNSIVVLLPPKYIDHLEAWNIKVSCSSIALPTIILKHEKAQQIKRAAAKSLLYSLNQAPFHEKIREVQKVDQNNPKVCMMLAQ